MADETTGQVAGSTGGLGRALVLLTMLSCAAALYTLAPAESFLWKPLVRFGKDVVVLSTGERLEGSVHREVQDLPDGKKRIVVLELSDGSQKSFAAGEVEVQEKQVVLRWMLLVSGVFFLLGSTLGLRFGRNRLSIYKPGQGKAVRLSSYACLLLLAYFGAHSLYYAGFWGVETYWRLELAATAVLGIRFRLLPVLFPSAAVFFLLSTAVHAALNRPVWADFLIETEGEVKKVSWPSNREFVGSSFVVLAITGIVAAFLFVADAVLVNLMKVLI